MALKAKKSSSALGTKSGTSSKPSTGSASSSSSSASGTGSSPPAAATKGLALPLINGRSSNGPGPDIDLTEPLNSMQTVVQESKSGDFVYLAAWFFEPTTVLTAATSTGALTWGDLFAKKAIEGVKIRILINDFDPISGMDVWLKGSALDPLDKIIAGLPAASRDNLKYMVQQHPAVVGKLKSHLAGGGGNKIHVASHHEKFMVTWSAKKQTMIAFCGGLDIESRKTPKQWSYLGLIGWHDIHVRLEGPVTRGLEAQFIARWNLAREKNSRKLLVGWTPMEKLAPTPLSPADNSAPKTVHNLQILKTSSENGSLGIYSTQQSAIKNAYQKAIKSAQSFIYMENQYFRSIELGNWLADQGRANPKLVIIIVVVRSAAADDGTNAVTKHGDYLQFKTFDLIMKAFGKRARIYTMHGRAVHSKFMMVDDKWMTIGSANANDRSFELDTETNIAIAEPGITRDFRVRLWAHNLGKGSETLGWLPATFLANWDAVAKANDLLLSKPQDMAGEGVVNVDYTENKGEKSSVIPDALAKFDTTPEGPMVAGLRPAQGGRTA